MNSLGFIASSIKHQLINVLRILGNLDVVHGQLVCSATNRSQVVAVGRKKSNGNSGGKFPTETVMTQGHVNLDVLQNAADTDAETPRMKRAGATAGAVSTMPKKTKGLDQQQRTELRQAAYAVMDERRCAMADSEAAAQVQVWIKATWLDKMTNQHGLSQAAVLWSRVADRADAGDQAMRGIGRRERGASGSNSNGAEKSINEHGYARQHLHTWQPGSLSEQPGGR